MQLLNITFPIGWQELATIVTAFGVVVSLFANRKASRQIKISLLAQEQLKNVELFDKRMGIIEKVQNGTLISSITIRLLFNKGIEEAYIAFELECARRFSAENDKDRYIKSISEELDSDGYPLPIMDKIKQYENAMNIRNCPSTVSDDFKTYCNEHEIYLLIKYWRSRNQELFKFFHLYSITVHPKMHLENLCHNLIVRNIFLKVTAKHIPTKI